MKILCNNTGTNILAIVFVGVILYYLVFILKKKFFQFLFATYLVIITMLGIILLGNSIPPAIYVMVVPSLLFAFITYLPIRKSDIATKIFLLLPTLFAIYFGIVSIQQHIMTGYEESDLGLSAVVLFIPPFFQFVVMCLTLIVSATKKIVKENRFK